MLIRCFLVFLIFSTTAFGQRVEVIKYPALQALIESKAAEIHVINFWATWCGPCIKELPRFEQLHLKNTTGLKVTLISMDFADQVDRVNRFLQRRKMTTPALLLDEINGNAWIDKVEPAWSGAIPATL